MRIEAGSQNASRIPGNYAYPVQRYNRAQVQAVNGIRGEGAGRALKAAAAAQQRSGQGSQTVMRDPIYEITHSTRAAKYLGTRGQFVNLLA